MTNTSADDAFDKAHHLAEEWRDANPGPGDTPLWVIRASHWAPGEPPLDPETVAEAFAWERSHRSG